MKSKNKIFILLPDGVGLRNFAFTEFYKLGLKKNYDIIFWNNTEFDLENLSYKEISIKNSKLHPLTEFFKSAKIQIGLNQFINKTGDKVYDTYRFPNKNRSVWGLLKNLFIKLLIFCYNSQKGLTRISKHIDFFERRTDYYKDCIDTLIKEKPAFVFCTNQRPVKAIAPLLAAKELGIKTTSFIFSWDNLPKATMVVQTDYYFVWSEFMKNELLFYYPYIKKEQIIYTGTPQFEPHYNKLLIQNSKDFFKRHNLNEDKKYICFSGDDITTSPNDQFYLEDVAKAVIKLNKNGYNYGIIYRKCPVDFSNRHFDIYEKYKDIIVLIDPLWKSIGNSWNNVMPTIEDTKLLVNTIFNSEMVINVGSSMVFDFVTQNKPCAFLNYNTTKSVDKRWNINTIYKFIHFKSMPSKDVVLWINSKEEIGEVIIKATQIKELKETKKWFHKICGDSPSRASENIWNAINIIIS